MTEQLELETARRFVTNVVPALHRSPAFQSLPPTTQSQIVRDLGTIGSALTQPAAGADPYALSLDTPFDRWRPQAPPQPPPPPQDPAPPDTSVEGAGKAPPATQTIATRAGALSDEVNFPAFVAGLVHGTFDAIVDATIRQMEAFAELVSAVAKDVDQFTRENVTTEHVRDWLAEQYPRDLRVEPAGADGSPPRLRIMTRPSDESDGEETSPAWLADFGLGGQPLTEELVETSLIPAARRQVGESRLKLLASMVLLGMSRVNVKDGTIAARVRFRAAARDRARVNYDTGPDTASWGERGSAVTDNHQTMVSTVGVNVQADSELKVELFGEVKINFVSETLPLEHFADVARIRLLERNARWTAQGHQPPTGNGATAPAPPPAAPAPPAAPPPAAPAPAPAAPATQQPNATPAAGGR